MENAKAKVHITSFKIEGTDESSLSVNFDLKITDSDPKEHLKNVIALINLLQDAEIDGSSVI